MDALKRNSRWSRDPARNPGGRTHLLSLTERDLKIFNLLDCYPYLPSDYIHAFVGGSPNALSDRLGALTRKPNLFLKRPEQQRQSANANHRRLVYQLDFKGAETIGVRMSGGRRNFAHDLMTYMIMANFELGVRKTTGARLITWSEIQAHPNFPASTAKDERPNAIESTVADWYPFGIERPHNGAKGYIFCPGIEADTGTEPVVSSNDERSSIVKKLRAYLKILDEKTYQQRWGVPMIVVPFITTSTLRATSILKCLHAVTNGNGSRHIIVTTCPSLYSFEKPLPPDGSMLTREWHRVGHAPFKFI